MTKHQWRNPFSTRVGSTAIVSRSESHHTHSGINKKKDIWGEDAYSFRPERWRNSPDGSHGCIGFRFALADIVACPMVKSEAMSGNHTPLIVRPASKDHVIIRFSRAASLGNGSRRPVHI
ncbi:hypothetical protein DFH29DRAFT_331587 [Suillus ampliporus]|nr:hypothetical protein DFH29DRAFT_331587 [Suillus ampliporus]